MANRRFLLALLPGLALAAACAPGEVHDSELDEHLCAPETLGDDFQELIRGDFTPKDLADLADNSGEREEAYREMGMERGKFVYFKQVLPKPPFDPPLNVVCQVIEFETEVGARAFEGGLGTSVDVTALVFSRVRGGSEKAGEMPVDDGPGRLFRATEGDTSLNVLVAVEERFVRIAAVRGLHPGEPRPLELLLQLWNAPTGSE